MVPQEGILTETQRQMFYTELIWAKNQGAPVPWRMIFEFAPMQMKDELLKIIEAEEQSQRQVQTEQLKEKKLLDQMRSAKIAADVGRAEERKANVAEHRADAGLARIKTMRELDKMDWDRQLELLDRMIALESATQKNSMTRR